jgi:hypothetical protein
MRSMSHNATPIHPARFAGLEALEPRLVMAADPLTPDQPLWTIPRGSAVIDGQLNDADWAHAGIVSRSQPWRQDRAVTVRMMYSDDGLFLAANVQTDNLWADGQGGGTGNRWEVESDDSVTFYFDPANARDEFLSPADRAIGVNLGNPSDPVSGSGIVKRWKYVQGDSQGGAPDALGGGAMPAGLQYFTKAAGTINNPADTDTGYTTEMFIPWSALNMTTPVHGQTMAMTFTVVYDNDGGSPNGADNRAGPNRFALPPFVDDQVSGTFSSYHASLSGVHGPVDYAEAMFIDARAGQRPAAITDLSATHPDAFGAKLTFTAPAGTTGGLGDVSAYQIRYSTLPITSDSDWERATVYTNAYVPRLRGLPESLQLAGLSASTRYYFSVRAVDAAGNVADLPTGGSGSVTFQTSPAASAPGGPRLVVSPSGNTLQFENGDPFIAVGDHLGVNLAYTRNLYPGAVWDPVGHALINYNLHPSYEGVAAPYFAQLKAQGVNTMRIFLELDALDQTGYPAAPTGRYWLEYPAGTFNPAMRQFLLNLIDLAAQNGIYLILSPFDTFTYKTNFSNTPFSTANGGPLTDIDDFFQTPATLDMAKARMATIASWVRSSPNANHVLGYEPVNEWDSFAWTLNPEGDGQPGRETEMLHRAQWVDALAAYTRSIDPDRLVLSSTISTDARGPIGRLVFDSRNFDMDVPHFYTTPSEEPVNSPLPDKSIMPAIQNADLTTYWLDNRIDNRPIMNGEWGMTRSRWPGGVPTYSSLFTQQNDEAIFRTIMWSGLASGQAGSGLRIAADELALYHFLLTPMMRELQLTMSRFINALPGTVSIDFSHFTYRNLAGLISAASPSGHSLLSWGISDGAQGIAYILQNSNATVGSVSDAVLSLDGLTPDRILDAEIWSTAPGAVAPLATIHGIWTSGGHIDLALPAFSQDVAVKFTARTLTTTPQQSASIAWNNLLVTFLLGPDQQPYAQILDTNTQAISTQDVSALSNFRGRAFDLTAYKTPDGLLNLAFTDPDHHVWIMTGTPQTNNWSVVDLTGVYGFGGLTGDLTTYQPSWGTRHIAGLDSRGHAINYWWASDRGWGYDDLTQNYNGPTLKSGLTGYVAPWDGLNFAGLNDQGEVIVYWWAPDLGPGNWKTQNMTADFGGPNPLHFTGQLDAFVTSWGALNIVGTTTTGELYTYWWVPTFDTEPNRWRVTNLSEQAGRTGAPALQPGVQATTSDDGGINLFSVDTTNRLVFFRWTPTFTQWHSAIGQSPASHDVAFPFSVASASTTIAVLTRAASDAHKVVTFSFSIATPIWQIDTPVNVGTAG